MRAVIYIRVSREEQAEGWSLDAQRDQCQQLAQSRQWTVVDLYEEPGSSAKTDQRPVFQKMMRDLRAKRFDVIIVHKLDRFSRNLSDVVLNIRLLKEHHVGLVSVTESWIDTVNGLGEAFLYFSALLAQLDNENRARETSKGKQARLKAGMWNGTLAFGYGTMTLLQRELLHLQEQYKSNRIDAGAYRIKADQTSFLVEQVQKYLVQHPDLIDGDAVPHPKNAKGLCLAFQWYSHGNQSDNDIAVA